MKISAPLGLFIAGIACFGALLVFPRNNGPFVILGGVFWVCAYFLVLADNFRRRAPFWSRGGLVKYEERSLTYRLVYAFLAFLGFFFLLVLIALNIFR